MSSNSQIAAARAFLAAGNFKQAITHAEEVLRKDPYDEGALAALGDTLVQTGDHARLETMSVDWLGRQPDASYPHLFLFFCYMQRGDEKLARALLDHYRTACPGATKDHAMFEATFQAKFGKAEEGLDTLANIYAADGDNRSAFKFNSLAALKRQNLSEAILEGEFARRSGDASAKHLGYMAMLCFRALRFAKCRDYARQALAAEPGMDIPRELQVLSYVVWFPPFLFGHAVMYLLTGVSGPLQRFIAFALLWGAGLPALVFTHYLLTLALAPLGLRPGAMIVVGLAFAYAMYMPFIGTLSRLLNGRANKEVQLADY